MKTDRKVQTPQRLRHDEEELAALLVGVEFGPAMACLSERHKVLVLCLLQQGSKLNFTAALAKAGYRSNRATMHVIASRLSHSEGINAAILEQSRKRLQSGTACATNLLIETIGDPTVERRTRVHAANSILDRNIPILSETKIEITNTLSREEKLLSIIKMARLVGINPKDFIGNLIDAVDADFKVLEQLPTEVDTVVIEN